MYKDWEGNDEGKMEIERGRRSLVQQLYQGSLLLSDILSQPAIMFSRSPVSLKP